jgi:hypothetical protein
MKGCLKEFELTGRLRVQDVDREIAFALLSLAYEFDRWEIGQVVAYVIHAGEIEVGRLVIAPGTGPHTPVRIREHHTLLEQAQQDSLQPGGKSDFHAEFVNLCHRLRQALEALQHAGGSAEAQEGEHSRVPASDVGETLHRMDRTRRDNGHFAYPRSKRLKIVQHYRLDRINGEIRAKDQWARKNYQISGRTLSNYQCEFPQVEEWEFDLAEAEPAGLE